MSAGIRHECGAWCRGTRHAVVIYQGGDGAPWRVELLARLVCARQGVIFVALHDAPEAPPPDPDGVWDRDWEHAREIGVSLADAPLTPRLLVYDCPEAGEEG